MVVKEASGRVLGSLDVRFDRDEVTRITADLGRELDAKLADPTNPTNKCKSYDGDRFKVV